MQAKTIEIRDRGTFIPVLVVRMDPDDQADRYLLFRAGFGEDTGVQASYVLLIRIEGKTEAHYDDLEWPNQRTLGVAHRYIIEHFDSLPTGSVVDVEFILGESEAPKVSERSGSWMTS